MIQRQLLGLGDAPSGCDPNSLWSLALCPSSDSYTQCSTQADNDPNYLAVQAQLQQVNNWTPTSDYFNPSDIQALVQQQQALVSQALTYIQSVGNACAPAPGCQSGDLVSQVQSNLAPGSSVMTRAQTLLSTANSAQSGISAIVGSGYVQVSGLKSWVQDSLLAIAQAIHAGLVIECQMPGWASLAGIVVSGFQSFASFAMSIVGVAANVVQDAVQAGTAIVKTAAVGGSVLDWILTNLPLVAGLAILGVGGFFVYKHRERIFRRRGGVAGLRDYEVRHEGRSYFFPTKSRAKAQVKLLEREYGGKAQLMGDFYR